MEANGAPVKIYLDPVEMAETESVVLSIVPDFRVENNDIEYTRTDAFIEKACDAYCAVCDTKECQGCAECSWVIKFRKQLMKIL